MIKTNEEREMLIELLQLQTGYSKKFFEKLTNEKIEYEFSAQLHDIKDWD